MANGQTTTQHKMGTYTIGHMTISSPQTASATHARRQLNFAEVVDVGEVGVTGCLTAMAYLALRVSIPESFWGKAP